MTARVGCPKCASGGCDFCNGEGYVDEARVIDYDAIEAREEDGIWLVCDDCGIASADVVETCCPFQEEIYGEIVECNLCAGCHYERALEI